LNFLALKQTGEVEIDNFHNINPNPYLMYNNNILVPTNIIKMFQLDFGISIIYYVSHSCV